MPDDNVQNGRQNSQIDHIVIVDDDELILTLYERYFSNKGYNVRSCHDGAEALGVITELPPDIVITDLQMPEMSGIDLLKNIKENYPNIEFIMITAFGEVSDSVTSFRTGAVDFLQKPVELADLDAAVERAKQRIWERRFQNLSKNELVKYVKELIQEFEEEKCRIISTANSKLQRLVFPEMDHLARTANDPDMMSSLEYISAILGNIFSENKPNFFLSSLTAYEIEICKMLVNGMSSQDISEKLNKSVDTIYAYQKKIRHKLGLTNSKQSLSTHLRSML